MEDECAQSVAGTSLDVLRDTLAAGGDEQSTALRPIAHQPEGDTMIATNRTETRARHPWLRRGAIVMLVSVTVCAGSTSAVSARQPARRACLGTTFSGAALELPAGELGQGIQELAHDPTDEPGVGSAIHAILEGGVPDELAPNACNEE